MTAVVVVGLEAHGLEARAGGFTKPLPSGHIARSARQPSVSCVPPQLLHSVPVPALGKVKVRRPNNNDDSASSEVVLFTAGTHLLTPLLLLVRSQELDTKQLLQPALLFIKSGCTWKREIFDAAGGSERHFVREER